MVTDSHPWSYMVPHGPVMSCVVVLGLLWSHTILYVPILFCMVIYGPVWSHLVPYWLRMDVVTVPRVHQKTYYSVLISPKSTRD